jgi:hypothetical protein
MAKTEYPAHGTPGPEARAQREKHWRGLIQEWERGGLSRSVFCDRKAINEGTFGWWCDEIRRRDRERRPVAPKQRRRRRRAAAQPAFVPVRLIEPAPRGATIEVVIGGRTVRVPAGFDPADLAKLIAVLEPHTC